MLRLRRIGRLARASLPAAAALLACSAAFADERPLPPRAQWRASSSSVETPAMAAAFAIDGDDATRWGGAFSPGHWLQVDLGRVATVAGALIHWDSGFAAAYLIQGSRDGHDWFTAFETSDAQGGIDYVFFPAAQARYLRLASVPRTADWGVSVFEFEPLSARDVPRISGLVAGRECAIRFLGREHPSRSPVSSIDRALVTSTAASRLPGAMQRPVTSSHSRHFPVIHF